MKIKSFFKESATLWYVGLLTVQFCAGLVFALDAERIHDTGKEIKLPVESMWPNSSNDSVISITCAPIKIPYTQGANPQIDAFVKNKDMPYWKKTIVDVEFRKGADGLWAPAAYGKNADEKKGTVFELKLSDILFQKYEGGKTVEINPPIALFNLRRINYHTAVFDQTKLQKYISDARKKNVPMSLSLRQDHGMLAVSEVYIGETPVEEIIEREILEKTPPQKETIEVKDAR